MPFWPTVGQEFVVDGLTYHVCEHPAAPGIPYGQEGRAGVVYQLAFSQQTQALKVFKRAPVAAMLRLLTAAAYLTLIDEVCSDCATPRRHASSEATFDLTYSF